MKNETIAVLMSTYNGEKYLKEQIDSIIKQKSVSVLLFIRDDGSTDTTIDIIKEYEKNYNNINFINKNNISNVGVKKSFLEVLDFVYKNYGEINYFSFADQDDVWKSDKLISGINRIQNSVNEKGALYYCNKIFVDKNLNTIKEENMSFYNDFIEILWPSLASGCTMIFNRQLAKYVVSYLPKGVCIHDSWVYRLAKCIGTDIFFDKDRHILYRQHDNNVCGMETTVIHHNSSYLIINFFPNLFKKREHIIQNLVGEIYLNFGKMMDDSTKNNVKIVMNYNKSLLYKRKLLFHKDMKHRRFITRLVWIYKVLFNMI